MKTFRRSLIRDGDTTTAGGTVQVQPQQWPVTYGDDANHACFEGDQVYCPACKSMGTTKCVKPYRPHTGPDGRQVSLDGDLCLCKCPKPPRLVARFNDIWAEFDAHELANMVGAKAWLEYAGLTPQYPSMEKHGKVFEFKNSETGQPLANRLFIVNDNGNTLKSKTDSSGRAIIEAPAGNSISIHLVFESPQGVLKYGK